MQQEMTLKVSREIQLMQLIANQSKNEILAFIKEGNVDVNYNDDVSCLFVSSHFLLCLIDNYYND